MTEIAHDRPDKGELEYLIKPRQLPSDAVIIEANDTERAALAKRFGFAAINNLGAKITLEPDGDSVRASGKLDAAIMQYCAISSEEFATKISEQLDFRFVAAENLAVLDHEAEGTDIEVELTGEDCDTIPYEGGAFDLGEAIAQSLGLAVDPYAEGPNADAARSAAGIVKEGEQDGPMAEALAGLKGLKPD